MESFHAFSESDPKQKLSSQAPSVTEQEFAHSAQGLEKPWKPLSFSSCVLLPLALFTACLAAMLGILNWQNSRNGALLFAAIGDSFSSADSFLYRFCPTIIVVLYGIGWSWIDLDIQRLEPWFQLAQSGGSSARASLLLHYPADFLLFVPFKAARQRQWTVVCASMITLLVAWVVIPLQNGIFSNNVVNISQVVDVVASKALLSVPDQSSKLGLSILNDGFSVLWLGQSMPAFTSADYAIAPFMVSDAQKFQGSNHTFSGQTTMYGTDLECKPPAQVRIHAGQATFDDGDGCVALNIIQTSDADPQERFNSYYIGYYDDANSDFSLQQAGCPQTSSHSFLAIWKLASNSPPDFHNATNATALFCKPSYYKQAINANVSLPGYSVISTSPNGPRHLLSELDFNITQFEYLLSNGIPPPWLAMARQDIATTTVLRQDSRLQNMSLTYPVTNMMGFAVGATHFAPEDYLDPVKLSHAFQSAHRLLFSLAIRDMFTPTERSPTTTGLVHSTIQAVTIIPVFALLSQAFLAFIAVATFLLLYLVSRRPGKLACDPDSLAQVMAMSSAQNLQNLFNRHDTSDDKTLANALASSEFVLDWHPQDYHPSIAITSAQRHGGLPKNDSSTGSHTSKECSKPGSTTVKPIEYSLLIGLPLCLGLSLTLSSLVYMHQQSIKYNGLPLPSINPVVQQVVLNYIPTALATVLEPTWSLLTRLACLMRPLEELRKGEARAQRSLLLEYTSLPPPLVIWRAIKSGDVFLFILALTALSANLLTVALGGLFSLGQIHHGRPTTLQNAYSPNFLTHNASDFKVVDLQSYNQEDAFYVASANFTNRTSLPSWTSQHYFFLPSPLDASLPDDGSVVLALQTTGYGAGLQCQEMTTTPSDATYELTFNSNATVLSVVTSNVQRDGSVIQCTMNGGISVNNLPNSIGLPLVLNGDPHGRKALELSSTMQPILRSNVSRAEVEYCSWLFARGWVRANLPTTNAQGVASNLSATDLATVSSTFISCRARPKSAIFNITISPSGNVLASTQVSKATYDPPPSVNLTIPLQASITNLEAHLNKVWHNDTFASDWSNYLFKTFTNSTSFLDASLPPPTFDVAAAVMSETYSRVFAIQMSLQSAQLVPAPPNSSPIPCEILTLERRVFMSGTMYRIAVVILSLDLLVAIFFYLRSRTTFLPRLPTSIASQIAYFAGSHVIDDVRTAGGDLSELDKHGYRYGYGKFVGKDGKTHIGIERVPFVTKLTREDSGHRRRR